MSEMTQDGPAVLVVDDEPSELRTVHRTLRSGGIDSVVCVDDSRGAMDALVQNAVDVVLLDLAMPHVTGEQLLERILQEHPGIAVIIFTGFNEVDTAVRCIKAGAFDYMVKPVEKSRLVSGVQRARELLELRQENTQLRQRMFSRDLEHPEAFAEIVTNSPRMEAIFHYAETVAPTAKPVFITGELGTGKRLLARAIHRLSNRPGDFIAASTTGLDDDAFADMLFGHVKGAFPGASEARGGVLEEAAQGTLFLDEAGDLGPGAQVRLLRLLQEREYLPLGSDVARRSDARLIVATSRDLAVLQSQGLFRKDLYYRLHTQHIALPPLRDRLEDIPALTDHFLAKAANALHKKRPTPPKALFDLLTAYHFPGNIRELETMVYNAVKDHASRVLSLDRFKQHIQRHATRPLKTEPTAEHDAIQFPKRFPTLKEMRRQQVEEALRRANGNQAIAAELLGITRTALNKWIKRNIEGDDDGD